MSQPTPYEEPVGRSEARALFGISASRFTDPDLYGYRNLDINLQNDDYLQGRPTLAKNSRGEKYWRYMHRRPVTTDQYLHGDVIIYDDSHLTGQLFTSDNIAIHKNGFVSGRIDAEDVTISDDARVTSDVKASGKLSVLGNSRVTGDALVAGNARVSMRARVSGRLEVRGDLLVDGYAEINGDIEVHGDAVIGGYARLTERMIVRGRLQVLENAVVVDRGPVLELVTTGKKAE